jgi:hypothetical protein
VLEIDSDPYSDFLFAMRSPKTKEKVVARLRMFFDFIGIPEGSMQDRSKIFADKAKSDQQWIFGCVVRYLQSLKERFDQNEITAGTIKNRYQAIRLFCDMSDIQKKISRALPKVRKYAEDRAPALDEIRKLIEYPDRRIKAVVYTMASSGIRVGAWDYLQWKHIQPVEKDGKIVAAKIIVYAGEDEEYFSFITLEAYRELEKWIEYRIQSGESITDNSWLMRNIWNTKKGYTPPELNADISLLSHNQFLSASGYVHAVGEFENNLDKTIDDVKIDAAYFDSKNKIIGTDFTYSDPHSLSPGESGTYEILTSPSTLASDDIASVKIRYEYSVGNKIYHSSTQIYDFQTESTDQEANSGSDNVTVTTYDDLDPKWQKFFTKDRTGVGGIEGGFKGFLNFEKAVGIEEDRQILLIK